MVGHYRIVAEIGRGGMGVVYRAHDVNLERDVALKCPRPDLASDPRLLERFLREAKTLSKLSHPNIIPVHEAFEEGGRPWLAAELVEGEDLGTVIERRGPLPTEDVLRHAEGLADALAAAHSKSILHRDIKPRNILIGEDGRARLADFGLARVLASEAAESVTRTASITHAGRVVGTRGYMSPEQIRDIPLDARSDIFCLGAVLYETCANRPAFAGPEEESWVDAILYREPPPLSEFNADVPAELERIIRKAIAKRPDERYQHATEMVADLRALRRRRELPDTGPAPRPPRPRWGPRSRAAVWAAVVVTAGLLAWWVGRLVREPPWPPQAKLRQLTSSPGAKAEPALAPDDSFVAYSSDEKGSSDIWLMDLASGVPMRLTDHPGADTSPTWYPDSSALLFVSDRTGSPLIFKVPRLGGAPIALLPDARDPAVSPDGTQVAFARPDPSGQMRIGVAPLRDLTQVRILTTATGGFVNHRHPAWSPDGRTIAYEDFRDLWLVPSAGGKAVPLTTDHQWNSEPAWSHDGRHVYFSSQREGNGALWRIQVPGGAPERVTPGMGPERQPSVARSGRRLAYSTLAEERSLTLLDRGSGRRTKIPGLRRTSYLAFSHDGNKVLFLSTRLGRSELWAQSLKDGEPAGDPDRLTDQPGQIGTYSLSPDDRWIAYHGNLEGRRDIFLLPASGGPARRLTDNGAANVQPSWSPDGKRLVFVSNQGGGFQIWIAAIADGKLAGRPTQITADEKSHWIPCWSPDGSLIAYIGESDASSEVWLLRADGSAAPRRVTSGAEAKFLGWDPSTGDVLVSGLWGAETTELRRLRPTGGDAVPVSPPVVFGPASANGQFAVSPDGTLLVYSQNEVRGEIWVMEAEKGTY